MGSLGGGPYGVRVPMIWGSLWGGVPYDLGSLWGRVPVGGVPMIWGPCGVGVPMGWGSLTPHGRPTAPLDGERGAAGGRLLHADPMEYEPHLLGGGGRWALGGLWGVGVLWGVGGPMGCVGLGGSYGVYVALMGCGGSYGVCEVGGGGPMGCVEPYGCVWGWRGGLWGMWGWGGFLWGVWGPMGCVGSHGVTPDPKSPPRLRDGGPRAAAVPRPYG